MRLRAPTVFEVRRFKRKLRSPLEWLGIRLGMLIFANVGHRRLFKLCDALSQVMYAFDSRGRRRALENLRQLFGGEGPMTRREELLVRGSYRNMARTVGHVFWTSKLARERVAEVGEMSRFCHEWLHQVKQAVTVSGHIGCWEILAQLVHLDGLEMISVAKRIGSDHTTQMLMASRRSIGEEIVAADGAFKSLFAAMKAGKSLGLLVDQPVPANKGGVWVRFLGRPIPVSAAPAFFSAKFKAPIVTAWSRPLKDGRYRCEVINTYKPEEARDVWTMTQRCARDLEGVIRRHPTLWVMNYNLFSNIPTEDDLKTLAEREAKTRS